MSNEEAGLWKKAKKAFAEKKYQNAVDLWNDYTRTVGGNSETDVRIALCHIMLEDYRSAQREIERALKKNPFSNPAIMTAAYLDLFHEKKPAALMKYAELLKAGYRTTRIKRILKYVKSYHEVFPLLSSQKVSFFLPFIDDHDVRGKILYSLAGVCFLLLSGYMIFFSPNSRDSDNQNKKKATPLLYNNLTNESAAIPDKALEEIYLYKLKDESTSEISSAKVKVKFETMKEHIRNGNVNQAIEINNEIQNSNLNSLLKEKFSLVLRALPTPDYSSFKNSQKIARIVKEPQKHKNMWMKYKGTVSYIRRKGSLILFDFAFRDYTDDSFWTAEVYIENIETILIEEGTEYTIFGKFRGLNSRSGKLIIRAVVIQEETHELL